MCDLPDDRPQKPLKNLQMKEFLPTSQVHVALIHDLAFLIPRILVQYLPPYEQFKTAVKWNVPHNHSAEMITQSQVVCV